MAPPPSDVTRLLQEWSAGRREAFDELFSFLYDELRMLAARQLRRERADHTLRATALVNEAYLKLFHQDRVKCENRAHFFAVAARAMRCLLVDHARARAAAKRDGGDRVLEAELAESVTAPVLDLLALDEALEQLARIDPRQEQLVELRYFGGLTIAEAAQVLQVSPATVSREWTAARAWLFAELQERRP
jgi:RNA polymerase sigma factor (TIGR02999 family)